MRQFRVDVLQRLQQLARTTKMWGSPAEYESAVLHLLHVLHLERDATWTLEQSRAQLAQAVGDLREDAEEHHKMRLRLWGSQEETARVQVVQGYAVLWAAAPRNAAREVYLSAWIEQLIDNPHTAGTPECLNAALFSLMGFLSSDLPRFAQLLAQERLRVGGHDLRPLHVVASLGPTDSALPYMYQFKSWPRLTQATERLVTELGSDL